MATRKMSVGEKPRRGSAFELPDPDSLDFWVRKFSHRMTDKAWKHVDTEKHREFERNYNILTQCLHGETVDDEDDDEDEDEDEDEETKPNEKKQIQPMSIFVPLCGDSPSIPFLLSQGHTITAVEWVEQAIQSLKKKLPHLTFTTEKINDKVILHSTSDKKLRVFQCNIFDYQDDSQYDLIYDRASLVALKPENRQKYVNQIISMIKSSGLLFMEALEKDDESKISSWVGPPYTATKKEVEKLFPRGAFDLVFTAEFPTLGPIPIRNIYIMQKRLERKKSIV